VFTIQRLNLSFNVFRTVAIEKLERHVRKAWHCGSKQQ